MNAKTFRPTFHGIDIRTTFPRVRFNVRGSAGNGLYLHGRCNIAILVFPRINEVHVTTNAGTYRYPNTPTGMKCAADTARDLLFASVIYAAPELGIA